MRSAGGHRLQPRAAATPARPIYYFDIVEDYPSIGGVAEFSGRLRAALAARFGARLVSAREAGRALGCPGPEEAYLVRERACLDRLAAAAPDSIFIVPNVQTISRDARRRPAVVNVVHDVQFRAAPQFFSAQALCELDRLFAAAREGADHVVFVSEPAQADFVAHFGRPRSSSVIPPVIPAAVAPGASREDYMLAAAHGGSHPHKNFAGLARLFAALAERDPDMRLVLTGHGRETALRAFDALPDAVMPAAVRARVDHRGHVSRAALDALYARARALVSLSLFEGFDMPAAEAAAHGTPLILSDIPVHRALHGRACLVDPRAPCVDTVAAFLAAPRPSAPLRGCDAGSVAGAYASVLASLDRPAFVTPERRALARSTALTAPAEAMRRGRLAATGVLAASLALSGVVASSREAFAQTFGGGGGSDTIGGGAGGAFNSPGGDAPIGSNGGGGGGGATLVGAGQPGGAGDGGGRPGGAGGVNGFDSGTGAFSAGTLYVGGDGVAGGSIPVDGSVIGGGGGGGAGGYGAILPGTGAFGATAGIRAGAGGAGGSLFYGSAVMTAGDGGDGGVGLLLSGAASFDNGATIQGGVGGAGGSVAPRGGTPQSPGAGGRGGPGVYSTSTALFTNDVAVTGGAGGAGGASRGFVNGGAAGDGGVGFLSGAAGANLLNNGQIRGGQGGNGGSSPADIGYYGGGGTGGRGVFLSAGGALTNAGTGVISGGQGGAGADGGVGVEIAGGTLVNRGTISGGAGLADATLTTLVGGGGIGVVGSNLAIVNSGSISGGGIVDAGASAGAPAAGQPGLAILFTGGVNSLTLQAGSVITGNVLAYSGADSLILGGDADASLSAALIGPDAQYRGFGVYQKTGASVWTLTGTTTALTPWSILGGTLSIASDGALGAAAGGVTLDGGTLRTSASFTTARAFTVGAGGGTFDVAAATTLTLGSGSTLTGAGGVAKAGLGTLVFGVATTYSGPTTVAAGTLRAGALGAFNPASAFSVAGGATLDLGGFSQTIGSLSGAGTVTTTAGPATLTTGGAGSNAFSGLLTDGGGALRLVKTGTGVFSLTGANSYSGGTRVTAGTLLVGAGGALGSGLVELDNNTTLAFSGSGYTLPNAVQFTGLNDPTIDSGAGTITMSGAISGRAPLTKTGSGALILTALNSYTGDTTIAAGTLEVDGSIASSPFTNVLGGARLTGVGAVGAINAAAGSVVAPGSAANPYGTLNATGAVVFAGGSTLATNLSPAAASRLNVTGTAAVTGAGLQVSPGLATYTTAARIPVLTTTAGVGGQFSTVTYTSTVLGLQPTVVYDASNVYLQFGETGPNGQPQLPLLDVYAAAGSVANLAGERQGQMITNRVLASVLGGFNEQINCTNCISGFGSVGSFSAGFHGRKLLTDNLSAIGGFAYADYKSGGVHVTSAPILAGSLRYDFVQLGSSRPWFEIGGVGAPGQRVSYSRAYGFGAGKGLGQASASAASASVFGRAGWVWRIGAVDEVSAAGELWRGWQRTGGFTEQASPTNPYPLVSAGGTDVMNLAKIGGQWTHLWGARLETQANVGYAHSFGSRSGLNGSINGGALPVALREFGWIEYGVRAGWRLERNVVLDAFADGTLGPRPIGATVHGGVAARYTF